MLFSSWWVAYYAAQRHHIPVTEEIFLQCKEDIQKLRVIIKFLLGVKKHVPNNNLKPVSILDKYMLHQLFEFHQKVRIKVIYINLWFVSMSVNKLSFMFQIQIHYEKMEYDQVCFAVIDFISNKISSLYVHISKDRFVKITACNICHLCARLCDAM